MDFVPSVLYLKMFIFLKNKFKKIDWCQFLCSDEAEKGLHLL